MAFTGPYKKDFERTDILQPASKKRKLDELNACIDNSTSSPHCTYVSEVPPRVRAKQQRPRYPHLHSEPPSISPSSNTPSTTQTNVTPSCAFQTEQVACVAFKGITPNDHEHAVDAKLALLLEQVREVQAETEKCRTETDKRRVERERELDRSFECRRVQREREFEVAIAQRKQEFERRFSEREEELESLFAQREKEIETEFGVKNAKAEEELRSVTKALLIEQAKSERIAVQLEGARKQYQELDADATELRAERSALERSLNGAMSRLLEAGQELKNLKKHPDSFLDILSLVVVDETREIGALLKDPQASDRPASKCPANLTAHAGAGCDNLMDFPASPPSSRHSTTSLVSFNHADSDFTKDPRIPHIWGETSVLFAPPCNLPLMLASVRAERIAFVEAMHAKHKSETRELHQRLDGQSINEDATVLLVGELAQTQTSVQQAEERCAKLKNSLDHERMKLESLLEVQKGVEQEAKRNKQKYATLKEKMATERKDAAGVKQKFTLELKGVKNELSRVQESLTNTNKASAFRVAVARGELEEVRSELEKLKSAVGPRQQHCQPEAAVCSSHSANTTITYTGSRDQGFYVSSISGKQHKANRHLHRRLMQAEAALVQLHLGVGFLSSTFREMLKDLKSPKVVSHEETDTDNHDFWDVADAYKRLLDKQ